MDTPAQTTTTNVVQQTDQPEVTTVKVSSGVAQTPDLQLDEVVPLPPIQQAWEREKKHACNICGKTFMWHYNVRRHQRHKHGSDLVEEEGDEQPATTSRKRPAQPSFSGTLQLNIPTMGEYEYKFGLVCKSDCYEPPAKVRRGEMEPTTSSSTASGAENEQPGKMSVKMVTKKPKNDSTDQNNVQTS